MKFCVTFCVLWTKNTNERYIKFFAAVCESQTRLVSKWMNIGFIHGVMNTDNMTVSGETIDYGPCAFMDYYDLLKGIINTVGSGKWLLYQKT